MNINADANDSNMSIGVEAPTITCSNIEATLLASLLGANSLIGLRDPFQYWLTEEIQEAWEEAKITLAERRYLEVSGSGEIVLDTLVAALMSIWAFPEASFTVTSATAHHVSSTSDIRYFHISQQLPIEQTNESEVSTRLTALADSETMYERICEIFGLRNQTAAAYSSGSLRESDLKLARSQAAQLGAAASAKALRNAGLANTTAEALSETLANPTSNSAIVALAHRTTSWEVGGLGILIGENGLWRLRSFSTGGENWVELVPCDASQAKQAISRIMNRVLPEPLASTAIS